jgi:hypothetical protein
VKFSSQEGPQRDRQADQFLSERDGRLRLRHRLRPQMRPFPALVNRSNDANEPRRPRRRYETLGIMCWACPAVGTALRTVGDGPPV